MSATSPAKRAPGRPKQTAEGYAQVRAQIVAATERVFAQHVHRDVTVQRIIGEAGITRPTFYRYFANADEPLAIILEEFQSSLTRDLAQTLDALEAGEVQERLTAGFDVYLRWSERNKHLLRSIHADLHTPASPVAQMRRDGIEGVLRVMEKNFTLVGVPLPNPIVMDVYLNSIEYTCYRVHLDTDGGPGVLEDARTLMLRIAVATLGSDTRFI